MDAMVDVTTYSPMKRGLKEYGLPIGRVMSCAVVTTYSPMKRGLKVRRIISHVGLTPDSELQPIPR